MVKNGLAKIKVTVPTGRQFCNDAKRMRLNNKQG
jgi:hypothetical protein